MRRRDLLGAGGMAALAPFLPGCLPKAGRLYWDFDVRFDGRVLVVGAGAAGLAAGYLLDRYGADYEILEASAGWGGRVQRLDGFVDVPIDLGAEWLHSDPAQLARLIDDPSTQATIDLIRYRPETYAIWNGRHLRGVNFVSAFYGEYKFERTTWYGFLERFIAPASEGRLRLDAPVVAIDHSGPRVAVTLADGSVEEADRVLLCVPLTQLQAGTIAFTPPLPGWKRRGLDAVTVAPGLKVFFEFDRRFYPDITVLDALSVEGSLDHLLFDGVFGKGSAHHLGTLFAVGPRARQYVDLDDDAIVDKAVQRFDRAFGGAASRHLVQARVQNWSQRPWIQGAYAYDWSEGYDATLDRLIDPVGGRLAFAGSYTSRRNWSTVHGAMESAYREVRRVLETPG